MNSSRVAHDSRFHSRQPTGGETEAGDAEHRGGESETGFACKAASLEAMTGQVYLAVVIARLFGLHATPPHAYRRRWTA